MTKQSSYLAQTKSSAQHCFIFHILYDMLYFQIDLNLQYNALHLNHMAPHLQPARIFNTMRSSFKIIRFIFSTMNYSFIEHNPFSTQHTTSLAHHSPFWMQYAPSSTQQCNTTHCVSLPTHSQCALISMLNTILFRHNVIHCLHKALRLGFSPSVLVILVFAL